MLVHIGRLNSQPIPLYGIGSLRRLELRNLSIDVVHPLLVARVGYIAGRVDQRLQLDLQLLDSPLLPCSAVSLLQPPKGILIFLPAFVQPLLLCRGLGAHAI